MKSSVCLQKILPPWLKSLWEVLLMSPTNNGLSYTRTAG
jgi:hypothetical protein